MSAPRLLRIRAASLYDGEFVPVPVNSGTPLLFDTDIGHIDLYVNIRHFKGSPEHDANSKYTLDGVDNQPNLQMVVVLTPHDDIPGDRLLYGNDFTYPIKDYVPAGILSAGLKFFNWFIDPTAHGDLYAEEPYFYGAALSNFLAIHHGDAEDTPSVAPHVDENLSTVPENHHSGLHIPAVAAKRVSYFTKPAHQQLFTFVKDHTYAMEFHTNLLTMQDAKYAVLVPTFGLHTVDIDILRLLNAKFNNVNFVVKARHPDGTDGVNHGPTGIVVHFELI